jgi:hypothetical protein
MKKEYEPTHALTLDDLNAEYSDFGQTFKTEDEAKKHAKNYPGSQIYRLTNHRLTEYATKEQFEKSRHYIGWLVRKIDDKGRIIKATKAHK